VQKARTQDSAKAFMQGLYGGTHTYTDGEGKGGITGHDRVVNITKHGCNTTYTIHARPKHQDPVLRFFDMCPAYDEYVAQIDADFLVRTRNMRHRSLPVHMTRLKHNLTAACFVTVQNLQAQLLYNCSATLPSHAFLQRDQTSDVIGCMGHANFTLQSVRVTISMLASLNAGCLEAARVGYPHTALGRGLGGGPRHADGASCGCSVAPVPAGSRSVERYTQSLLFVSFTGQSLLFVSFTGQIAGMAKGSN